MDRPQCIPEKKNHVEGRCRTFSVIFSDPGRLHIFYLGISKVSSLGALLVLLQVQPSLLHFVQLQPYETSAGTASPKCTRFVSTLPETNMAHEKPFFPGKYHQNGGFPMGILVYRSVPIRHWKLLPRNDFWLHRKTKSTQTLLCEWLVEGEDDISRKPDVSWDSIELLKIIVLQKKKDLNISNLERSKGSKHGISDDIGTNHSNYFHQPFRVPRVEVSSPSFAVWIRRLRESPALKAAEKKVEYFMLLMVQKFCTTRIV